MGGHGDPGKGSARCTALRGHVDVFPCGWAQHGSARPRRQNLPAARTSAAPPHRGWARTSAGHRSSSSFAPTAGVGGLLESGDRDAERRRCKSDRRARSASTS